MIDVKSSWGDYIMKKILTIGTTLLAGLSLAACGNQQSSTNTKSSTSQQTHGKYYFDGTTANLQDVKIKITGVKFYQGDETTNGKNVICFDYTITNKTDKDVNALTGWQAVFNAYQDNKNTEGKLEVAPMPRDTSDQILQEQDQSIKKGGSVQCRMAYELDSNKKPVVLKATKGYDGTFLGKKEYKIDKLLDQKQATSSIKDNDTESSSTAKSLSTSTSKVSNDRNSSQQVAGGKSHEDEELWSDVNNDNNWTGSIYENATPQERYDYLQDQARRGSEQEAQMSSSAPTPAVQPSTSQP